MRLASIILFVAFTATSSIASAQDGQVPPSAQFNAFLSDLTSGDSKSAEQRIARIESLSYDTDDLFVEDRGALIDLLGGCEFREHFSRGGRFLKVEETKWQCDDGIYEVSFVPEQDEDNPYLSVIKVMSPSMITAEAQRPVRPAMIPSPPPMRMLSDEEVAARVERNVCLKRNEGVYVTVLAEQSYRATCLR